MSKPKRSSSSGFSSPEQSEEGARQQIAKNSADHTKQEQQALELISQKKFNDAENIYRELIESGSKSHIMYSNLGVLLKMSGDSKNAIIYLKKAVQLQPNFPEAYNNLGAALKQQGDLSAAIAAYKTALKLKPNFPGAYNNLGTALKQQGDLSAAIASYNTALKLKPNFPDAHNNLGNALKKQGNLAAAIASYNTALKLNPNFPDAHNNLGIALQENGDLTASVASFNKALIFKPNFPDAYNNLGIALHESGDLDAAITAFSSALKLQPNFPEAHNNRGNTLMLQGDLTSAISSYNAALVLKPNFPDAYNNRGVALQEQGDLSEAISSYNTALELEPTFADAHANLSHSLLQINNYISGWKEFEWRHKRRLAVVPHANPQCKQWDGESPEQLEHLLLVSELGLGDTLQFMRYTTALRNQGITISLCAQQKLHSLIKTSGIDASPLTHEQANAITKGQWMPLLSVPRYLEVSSDNPVITTPYIKTTDELKEKWKKILSTNKRPIIGINWQGDPSHEKTNSIGRSLPLEIFAPIASKTTASLLSLQKGFGSEQLKSCSFRDRFVSSQDQIDDTWDFLECAAIISNCDLVITSDTSVAHLAGGMGKTTWLLLKKVPEWRWGLDVDTSFWYPSMRLFRQQERGNWYEVMEQVVEALQALFGGRVAPAKPEIDVKPFAKTKPIQDILAPISLGELVDKITILQIKAQHLRGTALDNVNKELEALNRTLNNLEINIDSTLIQRLKETNQKLWNIEDDIRDQEQQKNFGDTFIQLARSVYQQNDLRAAIKKEINTTYGSALVEEKSYQKY